MQCTDIVPSPSRSPRLSSSSPAPWAAQTDAFELVAPEDERNVTLVVGTGQLIRVDEEFSSLFVANPEVADVEVKSPRLMYLTGVGVGETTLFAVDDNDNVLMSARIKVTHNIDALQQGINSMAPGQSVTATTVDQSLVLTGTVQTAEQAANVRAGGEPVRRRPDAGGEPPERGDADPGQPRRCASPRCRATSTAGSASSGTT